MRKIFKLFKWLIISMVALLILIILFRNEIVLQILKSEKTKKEESSYSMFEIIPLEQKVYIALADDFQKEALSPINYILDEFKSHDIIFIGEYHRAKRDIEFAAELIPYLHKNGIHNMGFEFALNKDSLLIRDVITNKEYFDQEKANQIIFNMSPFWGLKEYIDLFKAAWEYNITLPDEAQPFMIHGIMHESDFSVMKKNSDKESEEIMIKVRKGVENPEKFMANCIINDFINKNEKAVIYCGMHHAFSGYTGHGNRVGVLIKQMLKEKVMTVSLHYPWGAKEGPYKFIYPVNGAIDAFIRKHKKEDHAFGINVSNNSFGMLYDTDSWYNKIDTLRLNEFCDGYIYLGSFQNIKSVTTQKKFINKKNVDFARTQLPNPELRDGIFKFVGPKVLNEIAGIDSDLEYRFRHLY